MSDDLARILAKTGPILFDFDGPVCSIFAGYPARAVAAELRSLLTDLGVELSESIRAEQDPLEVLRWTGTLGRPDLTRAVEDKLRQAEVRATTTAAPTPYAFEAIMAARQAGRAVSIVSNNSEAAITAYLEAHRLRNSVDTVVGRPYAHPERMKPNPDSILRAVSALHADPEHCLLIGDSASDINGSHAAGVSVVGYANKPGKAQRLAAASADAIVTSMSEILTVLLDQAATILKEEGTLSDTAITCSNCGRPRDESTLQNDSGARTPCPYCGATAVTMGASANLHAESSLTTTAAVVRAAVREIAATPFTREDFERFAEIVRAAQMQALAPQQFQARIRQETPFAGVLQVLGREPNRAEMWIIAILGIITSIMLARGPTEVAITEDRTRGELVERIADTVVERMREQGLLSETPSPPASASHRAKEPPE